MKGYAKKINKTSFKKVNEDYVKIDELDEREILSKLEDSKTQNYIKQLNIFEDFEKIKSLGIKLFDKNFLNHFFLEKKFTNFQNVKLNCDNDKLEKKDYRTGFLTIAGKGFLHFKIEEHTEINELIIELEEGDFVIPKKEYEYKFNDLFPKKIHSMFIFT